MKKLNFKMNKSGYLAMAFMTVVGASCVIYDLNLVSETFLLSIAVVLLALGSLAIVVFLGRG